MAYRNLPSKMAMLLILWTCANEAACFSPFTTVGTAKRYSRQNIVLCSKNPPPYRATRSLFSPEEENSVEVLDNLDREVLALEKEIHESTKAKLDLKRVTQLIDDDDEKQDLLGAKNWHVSLAAGTSAALVAFIVTHNWTLTGLTLACVYLVASGDPLEETTPAGAAARVLGRFTLQAVQVTQPKAKAMARVAIRGEDSTASLKRRIDELETENASLRLWQKRRKAVDASLNDYTLDQLKTMARDNNLTVGGTKAQLMMRLMEADIIPLD